jgi:hypothetical protein
MATQFGTPDWINNTLREGGGPVLGISVMLARRLFLSTEASIYFEHSKDEEKFIYANDPAQNRYGLHEYNRVNFNAPALLFLSFRF